MNTAACGTALQKYSAVLHCISGTNDLWFILKIKWYAIHSQQEPWRLPSRQAEFDGTDSLRLDAHSDDQAVTGNQGYFENWELKLNWIVLCQVGGDFNL